MINLIFVLMYLFAGDVLSILGVAIRLFRVDVHCESVGKVSRL